MKNVTLLFVLVFVCISFCTTAIAHPGMTDENGGHYDRSTGDYHYHHGYSSHYHKDMDGDGFADCPYEFDDRTGLNSGSSSRSNDKDDDSLIDTILMVVFLAGYFFLMFVLPSIDTKRKHKK